MTVAGPDNKSGSRRQANYTGQQRNNATRQLDSSITLPGAVTRQVHPSLGSCNYGSTKSSGAPSATVRC